MLYIEKAQKWQVFISYERNKRSQIEALCKKLEERDIRCWMDNKQMGGGDFLDTGIENGLTASEVFLPCITKEYVVNSPWCQ